MVLVAWGLLWSWHYIKRYRLAVGFAGLTVGFGIIRFISLHEVDAWNANAPWARTAVDLVAAAGVSAVAIARLRQLRNALRVSLLGERTSAEARQVKVLTTDEARRMASTSPPGCRELLGEGRQRLSGATAPPKLLRRVESPSPGVGDPQPQQAERPATRFHGLRLRNGESSAHDPGKRPDRELVRPAMSPPCIRADCRPGYRARGAA